MATMPQSRYYFESGPYPNTEGAVNQAASSSIHFTLEGAIQNFLDSLHVIWANAYIFADNPEMLDGALAQQHTLAYANSQIDAFVKFWPRFYLNSVPAGQTAEGIGAKYKQEAANLGAAYGVQ